jgi:hypothetical protein
MKSCERLKSALKYIFHNSFVLHECYEIVIRVRNRSQKNGVQEKKESFKGDLALSGPSSQYGRGNSELTGAVLPRTRY